MSNSLTTRPRYVNTTSMSRYATNFCFGTQVSSPDLLTLIFDSPDVKRGKLFRRGYASARSRLGLPNTQMC